jgi:hypothetical protein
MVKVGRRGLLFVVLVFALGATPAWAADEASWVFNPSLSLTGDCATSTPDPVADPGCPGGDHPPKGPFSKAHDSAVDLYGDRYVASFGQNPDGSESRVDVFDPTGRFITEVPAPGAATVAVDADGHLYVSQFEEGEGLHGVFRYTPTVWQPQNGEIVYGSAPFELPQSFLGFGDVDVDLATGHVFAKRYFGSIAEYGSAEEGNPFLGTIGEGSASEGELKSGLALAIDSAHARIYVSNQELETNRFIWVYELEAPHKLIEKIDGSTTPQGRFLSPSVSVAVDEESGHIFVGDLEGTKKRIYELQADGGYLRTIEKQPAFESMANGVQIEFDNGHQSPNRGKLYVPSGDNLTHSFVFEREPAPTLPLIQSLLASGITRTEAIFGAQINPEGRATSYRIEYTTEARFEAEGFAGALVAGEGTLAAALAPVPVSAGVTGLSPSTGYRFRIVAESVAGSVQDEATFTTYGFLDRSSGCVKEALRTGPSADLPDCRAYELVTPANTNGHTPAGIGNQGIYFTTREASLDGSALSFRVEGGPIPGYAGTGSLAGDPYVARRTSDGWATAAAGPDGVEAPVIEPGSSSLDQSYSFWSSTGAPGTLPDGNYLRYPDGHSEPIGRGSLGIDLDATGLLIASGASHVIFSSQAQLEAQAPAGGAAIYDRTSGEVTHLVSVLPAEVPVPDGISAAFEGASLDGRGVAFSLTSPSSPIYLRLDDAETYEAAPPGSTFAGLAEGGERLFYLKGNDLHAFDAETATRIDFSGSGDVIPVNISADGTTAYFVSPSALSLDQNPSGALPTAGAQNLYVSREGTIAFVGTVTEGDVEGGILGVPQGAGLGLWLEAVRAGSQAAGGRYAIDPSRTTPDGSVIVFESRADLTGYDPEGAAEIYRFDGAARTLRCLSCPPTRLPTEGGARLQSIAHTVDDPEPLGLYGLVDNVSADGRRVFFESEEALVLEDRDGLQDVYEWEEEGTGSCRSNGGCVYLISSGKSGKVDYLYATSADGSDAFFVSSDLLVGALDPDETFSIYDARIGGGFAPPDAGARECLGEACLPRAVVPPRPQLASGAFEGGPNARARPKRCPKGRRKVKRGGKVRCLPRRHRKKADSHHLRRNHR